MKKITALTLIFFIILTSLLISKKSSVDLKTEIRTKEQKENNIRIEIENIKSEIINNDIKSKETKNKLKLIEKQIKLSEKLLQKIREQGKKINSSITSTEINIKEKEKVMKNLQKEYSDMIIYLYKTHNNGYLDILLSSNSWNDAVYKMKYLEIISEKNEEIRDKLNLSINKLNDEIIKFVNDFSITNEEILNKKNEVFALNKDEKKEKKEIEKTNKDRESLQEKKFEKEKTLEGIKKLLKQLYLDKDLAEQREKEIEKKRAERLKRIKEEEKRKKKITDQKFANNKGKLSWPAKGKIIEKYGVYTKDYEVGRSKGMNLGISIKTEKNAEVKSVFDGKVLEAGLIEGLEAYGHMVYIYHNDGYYSYYANLNEEIFVTKNELIDEETLIGTTYSNDEYGKLTFFIMKVDEKTNIPKELNPEEWIK